MQQRWRKGRTGQLAPHHAAPGFFVELTTGGAQYFVAPDSASALAASAFAESALATSARAAA
jgi:hypothetical protein